jgi:hypothetical protein
MVEEDHSSHHGHETKRKAGRDKVPLTPSRVTLNDLTYSHQALPLEGFITFQ